jgi:hypothetical protein
MNVLAYLKYTLGEEGDKAVVPPKSSLPVNIVMIATPPHLKNVTSLVHSVLLDMWFKLIQWLVYG